MRHTRPLSFLQVFACARGPRLQVWRACAECGHGQERRHPSGASAADRYAAEESAAILPQWPRVTIAERDICVCVICDLLTQARPRPPLLLPRRQKELVTAG